MIAQSDGARSAERGFLSEIFVSYQGEGPCAGQLHLFVRFAGCNVRCRYCDTPGSLTKVHACRVDYPDGSSDLLENPLSADDLARIVTRTLDMEPRVSMIAVTGGEPMVQHRFLASWLRERTPPVPCLLETNALLVAGLEAVLEGIAVVSADLKLPSNSGEGDRWSEHRSFLETCVRESTAKVYVKMPVDDATKTDEVRRGARLVAELLPTAELFLQPVTDAENGAWKVTASRFFALVGAAFQETPRARMRPQLHKLVGMR